MKRLRGRDARLSGMRDGARLSRRAAHVSDQNKGTATDANGDSAAEERI